MNSKIQLLRGISIISVVAIHTNTKGILSVIDRPFLNFSVAMFLFCSGYLTNLDVGEIGKFFKKRIIKVGIPYIIWSIIYTVSYQALGIETGSIIGNILTGTACFTFYYILLYIQFVLLTPIVAKILISKYRYLPLIVTPLYIILTRYFCTFAGYEVKFPFDKTCFLCWFIYYYIGMGLKNGCLVFKVENKKLGMIYVISLAVSICEGIIWYRHGNVDMGTTQLRLSSVLTSVVAVLIAYNFLESNVSINKTWASRGLVLIGNCSFGIYLAHIYVMGAILPLPRGIPTPFPISTVIVLSITTLCVLIGRKLLGKKFAQYLGL